MPVCGYRTVSGTRTSLNEPQCIRDPGITQDPGLAVLGARVLPGVRGKGLRSLPGFGAMDVSKPHKFMQFGNIHGPKSRKRSNTLTMNPG